MRNVETNKLINVIYHQNDYYVHEPNGDKHIVRDPDLIIEKHCWTILKFLPKQRERLLVNDVVRFGRVTFKVTELVITEEEIEQTAAAIEALQNGQFNVGEQIISEIGQIESLLDQSRKSIMNAVNLKNNLASSQSLGRNNTILLANNMPNLENKGISKLARTKSELRPYGNLN